MNFTEDSHDRAAVDECVLEDQIAPEIPSTFSIHDATSANWVIRKIVEARAYADRVRQWAALEVRRAQSEEEFFLHRFGVELESWAKAEVAKTGDHRKSLCLPSGVVGFRIAPLSLVISDEQKLLDWAERHLREAVEVRRILRKSLLLDHLKTTGECPLGAEVAGGEERFYIR